VATPVSEEARRLVNGLVQLSTGDSRPAAEIAAALKENMQQLLQQGTNGIPAIREFLAKNTDLAFTPGTQPTAGSGSVRQALFDTLVQIGGPEAIGALSDTLQTTGDPREIAILCQNLEKLEPGQHEQEAVGVALQTLNMSADGKLSGVDVAPLFEVLQKYGDAGIVPELEKAASRWNIYAAVTLARMPDNAGVPALLQLAQLDERSNPPARAAAVQMLGSLAAESAEARGALLDLARQNKLSDYNWGTLSQVIGGEQYHFQNAVLDSAATLAVRDDQGVSHATANQNFFMSRNLDSLTADQIQQQTAWIDQLLTTTSSPAAIRALQQSRAMLNPPASP
jgi:hypothetical protein